MFDYKNQPWKTLYLLYAVPSVLFVRLPYWLFISAIPALRPHRSWTMTRTMLRHLIRFRSDMVYVVGLEASRGNAARDSARADKCGFVWVEPLKDEYVKGDIADMVQCNNVRPERAWGYWMGLRGEDGKYGHRAAEGERVLYYFHGGAYVMGSAHPSSITSNLPAGILATCDGIFSRAFSLEYRPCASAPYTPTVSFPAPLLDALSGYAYLLSLDLAPANIVVAGDSSGGHLAACLTRYLIVHGFPEVGPPGALLLHCPTMDWGNTHHGTAGYTMDVNDATDFVRPMVTNGYSAASLLGALPARELSSNAWLSPASLKLEQTDGLFARFPPTIIVCGALEQTVDAMRTFRDRLLKDVGAEGVRYIEYPEAFHDFLVLKWHEPERTLGFDEVRKWLREVYE